MAKKDRKLQAALAQHVFFPIEETDPKNQRALRKLRINGFPTFVLMNGDGAEIDRWTGFGKPSKNFIDRLARAAADPAPLEAKIAGFEKAPSADAAQRIGEALSGQERPLEALRFFDRAVALDPAREKDLAMSRLYEASSAYDEGLLTLDDVRSAADRALKVQGTESWVRLGVARQMISAWPDDADRAGLEPYVRPALDQDFRRPFRKWKKETKRSLEESLLPPRTIEQRIADFEERPTADGALEIARELYREERYAESLALLRRVGPLDEDKETEAAEWILAAAARGVRDQGLPLGELKQATARYLELKKNEAPALLETADWAGTSLAWRQDKAWVQELLDAALATPDKDDGDDQKKTRQHVRAWRALVVENDGAEAVRSWKDSLGEYWEEDPALVEEFARFLWRSGVDLDEAERQARAALALASRWWERSRASHTLAEVLRAKGRTAESVEALAAAVKAAPRDKVLKRKLAAWQAAPAGT